MDCRLPGDKPQSESMMPQFTEANMSKCMSYPMHIETNAHILTICNIGTLFENAEYSGVSSLFHSDNLFIYP